MGRYPDLALVRPAERLLPLHPVGPCSPLGYHEAGCAGLDPGGALDVSARTHNGVSVDHLCVSPSTDGWSGALWPSRTFLDARLHQAEGMVAVQLGVGVDEAVGRLRIYAAATDQRLTDVACSVVERRLQLSSPTTVDAAGNVVMWDLGSGSGVSRQARGHMSALVTSWGLDDDHGDSALYVMNELVDNAVDHGGGLLVWL